VAGDPRREIIAAGGWRLRLTAPLEDLTRLVVRRLPPAH
jgi:hypothetical protein